MIIKLSHCVCVYARAGMPTTEYFYSEKESKEDNKQNACGYSAWRWIHVHVKQTLVTAREEKGSHCKIRIFKQARVRTRKQERENNILTNRH